MPNVSTYKAEPATLGEAMLRELPHSVAKIATALGLRSPQAVQFWRHGLKLPGPESRERLAATYGIPVDAWSRPATGEPEVEVDAEPGASDAGLPEVGGAAVTVPPVSSSALAGVHALLREVRARRRPKPDAEAASSMDYFRSVRMEMDLLRQIAQFEQAAEAMDDRIIRTNPRWAKIRDGLADVLAHYPEAAERVGALLDRLDV
jgi:transcriptional regulator with XRE-family HTH domain